MKSIPLLLLLVTVLLFSCKGNKENTDNSNPFANCKCGSPLPIFKDNLPNVIDGRNFAITNKQGIENVFFKDGVELQIIQSGCDDLTQEFTFKYRDRKIAAYSNAEWIQHGATQFLKIGGFAPRYASFQQWGEAIEKFKDKMVLGESMEMERGFFMKIDKVANQNEATMIVTMHVTSCGQ